MISHQNQQRIINNVETTPIVYYGLSTDQKPTTGVGNGSCFIEMDTSKIYFYDENGSQWLEWGN